MTFLRLIGSFIIAHWGVLSYILLALWRALPNKLSDFNWYDWIKMAGDSLTNTPHPSGSSSPKV